MNDPILHRLRGLVPDIESVAGRFPLPLLAASAFTLYYLAYPDRLDFASDTMEGQIGWALTSAFLVTLAVKLFAEARGIATVPTLAAGFAGGIAVSALCFAADRIELRPWILLLGLQLLVGLAPFALEHGRAKDGNGGGSAGNRNGAVWLFNHRLWVGWTMALLALLVFACGASAIAQTLHYLFGVELPPKTFSRIWLLSAGLIAPVYWLSQVPRRFEEPVEEGTQTETISRMTGVIARFIVVPLLRIYAVILHVYAVKIGLDGALPKGRIGWMVSSFGTALAFGGLVVYPTRGSGGPLVALFWQVWPWLLAVPLGMLFLAIGQRVNQYGFSEHRYQILMLGIWFIGLIVSQGILRRDLRLVPALLGALLIAASFGPWGSFGLSVRSQVAGLKAGLAAAGITRNGVVPAGPLATNTVHNSNKARLAGITSYLSNAGRLDELAPLFAPGADNPFQAVASTPPPDGKRLPSAAAPLEAWQRSDVLRQRINHRLGIDGSFGTGPQIRQSFQYSASLPWWIPAANATRVAGQINLAQSGSAELGDPGERMNASFDGAVVTIEDRASGKVARFDIAADTTVMTALTTEQSPDKRRAIKVVPSMGDLAAEIWLVNVWGQGGDDHVTRVNNVGFILVLGGPNRLPVPD